MDATPSPDEWNNYLLPSTFSLWHGDEPIDSADTDGRNTTDAARPNVQPVFPHTSAALSTSRDISTFPVEQRASSAFGSPAPPLDVASGTTTREPRTLRDHAAPQSIMPLARSTRPAASTAETNDSLRSSHTRRPPSSTSSTLCASISTPSTEQGIPIVVSNVDSRRSTAIMPAPPEAQSFPMTAMYNINPALKNMASEDEVDPENVFPRSGMCTYVALGLTVTKSFHR